MDDRKPRMLIVTGLSGAGMATALKALEDEGYKVTDNLPLALVAELLRQERGKPVAVGIDSRTWDFSPEKLLAEVRALKEGGAVEAEIIFMDCQDAVLQQRYTETRRVHPLAVDRPLADGVAAERRLMEDVRAEAVHVIDTTQFTVHDLRRFIASRFPVAGGRGLRVFVLSFSFRKGLPREADLVFDVRFLENPHWDPALRPLSGLDAPVAARVRADPGYAEFFANLTGLLRPLLPRYDAEGKNYLTVAVGCTGGRHRSVAVAEALHAWLAASGHEASVRHRDIDRPGDRPEDRPEDQQERTAT